MIYDNYEIDSKYCVIEGWMVSILKLSGTELLIFAIIYGLTNKDDSSEYYGNLSYFERWSRSSDTTVTTSIKKLVDRGLIIKREIGHKGFVKKYGYKANIAEINEIVPKKLRLSGNYFKKEF